MSEWDTATWMGFIFTLIVPVVLLASIQMERGSDDGSGMS